jgi:hypothetical protein
VPTALGSAVEPPCLDAGHRAAGLPCCARAELSGLSCPRVRRRHTRTVLVCWPSRQAFCAGARAPPCRRAARTGYQAAAPCGQAGTRMARVVVPGFDPCMRADEAWGRRAVTRRRRRHRARLPGRRAARHARDHGCERPSGRHTPVPSRVVRFSRRVMKPGRLAPEPSAGGAPRGRGAARAFRRAPGVRVYA